MKPCINPDKYDTDTPCAYNAMPRWSIGRRCFHADLRKSGEQSLGVKVQMEAQGARIVDVNPGGAVSSWNERCSRTWPQDQLQVGDLIIRVNGVGPVPKREEDFITMNLELGSAVELLLVVSRQCRTDT